MESVGAEVMRIGKGWGGGGEKACCEVSVSWCRIDSREGGSSHGGGMMLARRWRLRRSASHNGKGTRLGGSRGAVGPYEPRISILRYLGKRDIEVFIWGVRRGSGVVTYSY
jgi:hypothetical protein